MNKTQELREEFRSIFSGRAARALDAVLPPLVFLIANAIIGSAFAIWAAVLCAALFTLARLLRKENLLNALGGFGGTLLAALLVRLSGSESGFFLPGLVSGALTVGLCLLSLFIKRPVIAYSSALTRRWPLGWYWHPRVLPAYMEVTFLWAAAFLARLLLQANFYQRGELEALGTSQIVLGWPFIIALLVVSYLYGQWRLSRLGGPSVEEFKQDDPPPWQGQRRGF